MNVNMVVANWENPQKFFFPRSGKSRDFVIGQVKIWLNPRSGEIRKSLCFDEGKVGESFFFTLPEIFSLSDWTKYGIYVEYSVKSLNVATYDFLVIFGSENW